MGRHVFFNGEICFYLAGWVSSKFFVFHGKSVAEIIPLCRKKLAQMHMGILLDKIPFEHPPTPKADVGYRRDSNWWFAVAEDGSFFPPERLHVVEYHTMLAFYETMCGMPRRGIITIEDGEYEYPEPDSDVDPEDVDSEIEAIPNSDVDAGQYSDDEKEEAEHSGDSSEDDEPGSGEVHDGNSTTESYDSEDDDIEDSVG